MLNPSVFPVFRKRGEPERVGEQGELIEEAGLASPKRFRIFWSSKVG